MASSRLFQARAVLTILAAVLSTSAALAGTERVLHTFNAFGNGGNPQASLIADAAGNLYGTASTGGSAGGGLVFKLTPTATGRWTETILHNFQGGTDGYYPLSGLVFDKKGNLYGTTYSTGNISCGPNCLGGTVFELSPNADGTWTEKILHTFKGADGDRPQGTLIFDSAGNLYGTTSHGGRVDCLCGTVFELSPTDKGGWNESILYSFTGKDYPVGPVGGVIFDSAGNLYGTTYGSFGSNCTGDCGTAFKLSPSSTGEWTETILHQFTGYVDGGNPSGGLIFDGAGNIFGNTYDGAGQGGVFELSPVSGGGWVEKTISVVVSNPVGNLVFDSFGNLYGVSSTVGGGGNFVFELSPGTNGGWQTTIPYTFQGNLDGSNPLAGLMIDAAGNLYGTTQAGGGFNCYQDYFGTFGCGTVFKLSRSASGRWVETQLYNFPGTDGQSPVSLISDGAGTFYGVTGQGGAYGAGEIFKLTSSSGNWVMTTLYSFTGFSDGGYPNPVVLGADGSLYGTTSSGGLGGTYGCGVVFQISPAADGTWKEKVIHVFLGTKNRDGCYPPPSSLLLDRAGNLYGGTQWGGNDCPLNSTYGCGAIFELTPAGDGTWTETILHRFYATAEGVGSQQLLFDGSGNLFGMAGGGTSCNDIGACGGIAFEMSPSGGGNWTYKVIYDFPFNAAAGSSPNLIIVGPSGNLYGNSDPAYACGSVFELSPTAGLWNLSTLYSFTGNADGCTPLGGLTLDARGNLYGTTYYAQWGTGSGTVFELSPSSGAWNLNTLYTFTGRSDGGSPDTNLVLDSVGNLYGMTGYGGNGTGGVIFEVQP